MTSRLYIVLAEFLELLADSTSPVAVGQVGPSGRYKPKESKVIGATVLALASAGFIERADFYPSCRPPSKRRVVRRWQPICREACRRKAQEFRQTAARLPDDESTELNSPQQLLMRF